MYVKKLKDNYEGRVFFCVLKKKRKPFKPRSKFGVNMAFDVFSGRRHEVVC